MNKADISFFEEIQGILENQPPKAISARYDKTLKEKKSKEKKERQPKTKGLIQLLSSEAIPNPCQGCPLEARPKMIPGSCDLDKAKLLVITEKVNDLDLISRDWKKNDRYKKFLPFFLSKGFIEEEVYWVALSRCSGKEDPVALEHCLNYLRKEILSPNIKCVLLLGVRVMQILIDKKRSTIFKARGQIFELLGKPCLITTERIE